MKYLSFAPTFQLQQYVKTYLVVEDTLGDFAQQQLKTFPGTHTEIVFSFGDSVDFVSPSHYHFKPYSAYVSGHTFAPNVYTPRAFLRFVGVVLTPLGAGHLLGVPQKHFVGKKVDLEDIIGLSVKESCDKLHYAKDHLEAIRVIETFLCARLRHVRRKDAALETFVNGIDASHGSMRLSALVYHTGVSVRNIERAFKEHVGFSAKQLCRLSRFARALHCVNAGAREWSRIVGDCGYYDQAHFIKEFKLFTNLTPARYLLGSIDQGVKHSFRELVNM